MLGPILGHTTDTTTRIWIAADGGAHRLEVEGGPTVPFRPTETGVPEFGTAIADATGLTPDTRYRYTGTLAGWSGGRAGFDAHLPAAVGPDRSALRVRVL